MSTMPALCLLCLYYVYYACTCELCLFITTDTLLLEQDVATVKDGLNIFSERFSKSFVILSNQVTSHKFSLVNFALGCQYFLHRLWSCWMINHFYVSCK